MPSMHNHRRCRQCAHKRAHMVKGGRGDGSVSYHIHVVAIQLAEGYTRRALLSEIHLRREAEGGGMEIVFNQQLPRLG